MARQRAKDRNIAHSPFVGPYIKRQHHRTAVGPAPSIFSCATCSTAWFATNADLDSLVPRTRNIAALLTLQACERRLDTFSNGFRLSPRSAFSCWEEPCRPTAIVSTRNT